MAGRLAIFGAAGIALGALAAFAAYAQKGQTADAASAQVTLKAQEIVAARRAAYFLSTQAVGQIKAATEEGGDLRRAEAGGRMLANWAKVLPTMFPEGSNVEGTRALDTVWSDRAGFEARAADYQQAASEVARIAAEGNREETAKAFMAMAATCHACHTAYRKE